MVYLSRHVVQLGLNVSLVAALAHASGCMAKCSPPTIFDRDGSGCSEDSMDFIGSTGGDDTTSNGDPGATTGDGDTTSDGDGDTTGDGDGDTTGDEDTTGNTTGGDGDGDGQDCAALDALTLSEFAIETPPGWAPGGPVMLRATMTNTSDEDITAYPGMLVAMDHPHVTAAAEGTWLFAIFAGMSSPIELSLEVSEAFVSGTSIDVEITEDLLNESCPNAETQVLSLTIGD